MALRAQDVFTPGAFPSRTYIERSGDHLEQLVRDAISTAGQIVSLIGPSKSGKTVLVEKVVGIEELITITGAGITSAEDIWSRVLDWMDVPASTTTKSSTSGTVSIDAKAGVKAGIPLVVRGEAEIGAGAEVGHERAPG